jgi:adenine-specific DNA-methyltransferase
MEEIKKQELTSMDIKEAQLQKLKDLFPEAFTEGLRVDWDKLRLTLGDDTVDTGKERYGMSWPGKTDCFKTIQQPSIATLVPSRDESIDFDTTQNIFIEGDNLEVLKLLQKSYLGKIKLIYIDPPYNTGNDFIYPDNYSENLDTYLEYTGQIDGDGRKFATNTETDGRFHSKWMNMMYPRLFLAKNLLKEDGVIFISIDDNELNNLRLLCNEIFGEENFVANIIWQKKYAVSADDPGIAAMHDYILCFQKSNSFSRLLLPRNEKQLSRYKNLDNDPRGNWSSDNYVSNKSKEERPTLWYPLIHPKTGLEVWPDESAVWRYSKENHERMVLENRLYWGPNQSYEKPRLKRFLAEIQDGLVPSTWWTFDEVGHNDEGQKETAELIGKKVFSSPKPVRLIKRILDISVSASDIVLDFFAGSGSAAHAVLELNKEDGGVRKFICVQIPEPTDEKSDAYKEGYKTIADIGKERIRRAGFNITKELKKREEKSRGQLFESKQNNHLDLGFKVYKLQRSNFKIWDTHLENSAEAIQQKLFEHIQHISQAAQQEAVLYELLLKSGFELTTAIETLSLAGKTVFSIADGQLLICLEKEITQACIKAMAEKEPSRVICLDEAFTGTNADALKTNAVQIMKSKGVVNFRTV